MALWTNQGKDRQWRQCLTAAWQNPGRKLDCWQLSGIPPTPTCPTRSPGTEPSNSCRNRQGSRCPRRQWASWHIDCRNRRLRWLIGSRHQFWLREKSTVMIATSQNPTKFQICYHGQTHLSYGGWKRRRFKLGCLDLQELRRELFSIFPIFNMAYN